MSATHTIIWENMEFCNLILVSTLGYIVLFLHDVSQLGSSKCMTRLTMMSYVLVMVPYLYVPITMSISLTPFSFAHIIIILSLICFFGLLVYSVLLEIPIHTRRTPAQVSTETADGTVSAHEAVNSCKPSTYTRGTYRLCRHPGFIWLTVINILYILLYHHQGITLLMIVLTICNLILIILEDTLIFPKIFCDYETYRGNVPFLNIFHR